MLVQKVLRAVCIHLLLNPSFFQIHALAAEDSLSLEEQHSNLAGLYVQGYNSEETYHNHDGEDDDTLSLQSTQFVFGQDSEETEDALDPHEDEEQDSDDETLKEDQEDDESEIYPSSDTKTTHPDNTSEVQPYFEDERYGEDGEVQEVDDEMEWYTDDEDSVQLEYDEDVHSEDSDSDAIFEEIEDSENSDDDLFEDVSEESRSHPHRRINKDLYKELSDQNPGTTDVHEKKTTQDEDIYDELVYEDSTDEETEDTEDGESDDYEDVGEEYEEDEENFAVSVDTAVFFQRTFDYEAADFEVDSDEYEEDDLYVGFQDSDDDSEEAITFDELMDKTPFNTDDLRKKFRVLFRISIKDYEDEDEGGKVTLSGQPEYFNDTYSDIPHSRNKPIIKFPYGPITEEEATNFRPKFEQMINNTWFHRHKYHDLIKESSGIDRIFAEFNDIIPMFYEPCLKDEFSQRMNSSETTGYTYHENFLQFNQYSNKSISEIYAYFKPAKKQAEPVFYDIQDVPRDKYGKIRRLFNNVFYDVYLKDQQGELLKHLQVGYSSVLMYKHTQKCWLFGFMVNADHSHTEPNSFAAKATERCAYAISSYLTGDPMGLYLGKAPAT